ncbi:unnamed protein product [Caenorhabditis angaria]|uniref:Uncharacterized protein n=1 Tax=Caenorhabditis angaria TaxID=860376 RepID=A0A9P1NAX6_9PELO|nr:unnamed protein product [Caenorhabditis angaria]
MGPPPSIEPTVRCQWKGCRLLFGDDHDMYKHVLLVHFCDSYKKDLKRLNNNRMPFSSDDEGSDSEPTTSCGKCVCGATIKKI